MIFFPVKFQGLNPLIDLTIKAVKTISKFQKNIKFNCNESLTSHKRLGIQLLTLKLKKIKLQNYEVSKKKKKKNYYSSFILIIIQAFRNNSNLIIS